MNPALPPLTLVLSADYHAELQRLAEQAAAPHQDVRLVIIDGSGVQASGEDIENIAGNLAGVVKKLYLVNPSYGGGPLPAGVTVCKTLPKAAELAWREYVRLQDLNRQAELERLEHRLTGGVPGRGARKTDVWLNMVLFLSALCAVWVAYESLQNRISKLERSILRTESGSVEVPVSAFRLGPVSFGKDGTGSVRVKFEKPFQSAPVISIDTALLRQPSPNPGVETETSFEIRDVTKEGFELNARVTGATELRVRWTATGH